MLKEKMKRFQVGLERESLRIDQEGKISKKKHPHALGSPLTHPYISTDFGEQQLEWNTPPKRSFRSAEKFLEELMIFSLQKLKGELFWPFSMPCCLDHIEIAQYGTSHEGRKKKDLS